MVKIFVKIKMSPTKNKKEPFINDNFILIGTGTIMAVSVASLLYLAKPYNFEALTPLIEYEVQKGDTIEKILSSEIKKSPFFIPKNQNKYANAIYEACRASNEEHIRNAVYKNNADIRLRCGKAPNGKNYTILAPDLDGNKKITNE